ncbi:MAG: chromosomal replication initiator protein DnaA [Phycisphaerales bacterium]|nr:chromosomal replication initiator protein DnaA [Phycisphaerales bacterium]
MSTPIGSGMSSHAESARHGAPPPASPLASPLPALPRVSDVSRRSEPAPARRSTSMARRPTPTPTISPDRQLWQDMLLHLRKAHPTICRAWFEELEVAGLATGTLNLRAQSEIHRNYLQRTCADAFNDAVRTVSQRLISIRFLGPEEEFAEARGGNTSEPAFSAPAVHTPVEALGSTAASAIDGGAIDQIAIDQSAALPDPYAPADLPPTPAEPESAGRVEPPVVEVRHIAPVQSPHPAQAPSRVVIESGERREDSLVIDPDYSFESFVVGPGNRLAQAAAVAVGESQGRQYNPLFIHGGVGLGKTHLLQAACLRILSRKPQARVYYVSCEGFMTQFMESVQSGKMAEFRHRFRDVDVLVVDDIHFLAKRDRTQEEFFHTFNTLYQAGKQILLSSDAAPEEIPALEERLISRFKWGLVAKIDPPCYETRVAILKSKAKDRGLAMPDDCACFIAARIDTNIRELEGAITNIQMYMSVHQRALDLSLVKMAMNDRAPEVLPEPSIQQIITAVTDFFRIRLADLQSKKRPRSVTVPRQVCMYFARKMTRLSLEEIGGYFGGRDHTTVMHAVRAVENRRDTESEFGGQLKAIEDKIRASG